METIEPFTFKMGATEVARLYEEEVPLPLNKPEYNFLVTETNYGIKKNLKNIILIELSFDGISEIEKTIRDLSNSFVEKELTFTINVCL